MHKTHFITRWLDRGAGLLPRRSDGGHGPLDGWSGKIQDACTDPTALAAADTDEYQIVIPRGWVCVDVDLKNCSEEQKTAAAGFVELCVAQPHAFEVCRSKSGGYHIWARTDRDLPKKTLYGGQAIEVFGPGGAVTEAVDGSGKRPHVSGVITSATVPWVMVDAWLVKAGFAPAEKAPKTAGPITKKDLGNIRRSLAVTDPEALELLDRWLAPMEGPRSIWPEHVNHDELVSLLWRFHAPQRVLKGRDLRELLWLMFAAVKYTVPGWSAKTEAEFAALCGDRGRKTAERELALKKAEEDLVSAGPGPLTSDAVLVSDFLAETGLFDVDRAADGGVYLDPDTEDGPDRAVSLDTYVYGAVSRDWYVYCNKVFEREGGADAKWLQRQGKLSRVSEVCAAIKRSPEAQSFEPVPTDIDPDHILTPEGLYDLRTAAPAEERAGRWIKSTAYPPVAMETPRWCYYLDHNFDADPAQIEAFERILGWLLTGRIEIERAVYLLGGPGGGKSLLQDLIGKLLGSYNQAIDSDTFRAGYKASRQGKQLALQGARVAFLSEPDRERFDFDLFKKWVSGELKERDRRVFSPIEEEVHVTSKLVISANLVPNVGEHGGAFLRRLIPVPLNRPIARPDVHLKEKLTRELPGILHRAMAACARWYAAGANVEAFGVPDSWYKDFTSEQEDGDELSAWIKNNLRVEPGAPFMPTKVLFDRFRADCPGAISDARAFGVRLKGLLPSGRRYCTRMIGGKNYRGYDNVRWIGEGSDPSAESALRSN